VSETSSPVTTVGDGLGRLIGAFVADCELASAARGGGDVNAEKIEVKENEDGTGE